MFLFMHTRADVVMTTPVHITENNKVIAIYSKQGVLILVHLELRNHEINTVS